MKEQTKNVFKLNFVQNNSNKLNFIMKANSFNMVDSTANHST